MASVAAGFMIGFGSLASASPPDQSPPQSGDDRATAHAGNVVAADCADLFAGSVAVPQADIDFTGGDNAADVDITAVSGDVTVVGVVVKGGNGYNVYEDLGDLPWLDLHAPLVPSGEPAAVSHWFVCAVDKSETSTPPTESPTDTTPTDTPPAETTTTGTAPGGAGSTSTGSDVSDAAQEQDLAETGVATGPLVALGAALLLGGGALMLVMRSRGARR